MADQERPPAGDDEPGRRAGDNGFDPDASQKFVERILNLHSEMESETGRIRKLIKDVYGEARESGIPKALLAECISEIRGGAKEEARRSQLDTDYPGQLAKLRLALGLGTPTSSPAVPYDPGPPPRDSWNPNGETTQ